MTTNDEPRWPHVVILVTMDDADGPLIITEHVAIIVNQRVRQHQGRPDTDRRERSVNELSQVDGAEVSGLTHGMTSDVRPCDLTDSDTAN